MILKFSVSMFGYLIVHRKISSITLEFAFPQHITITLWLSMLVLYSTLFAFFSSNLATFWVVIGILLITLNFFPEILRNILIRQFQHSIISVLDFLLLSLQSGKSFQRALSESIHSQNGWGKNQLIQVLHSMQRTDTNINVKPAPLKEFREQLVEIQNSQVRCIDQVKALRRQLKMVRDFRRRSGQVTQQIKMQAIIVTALYISLLSFVVLQFGFVENRRLIILSISMFLVGLFWIFNTGRKLTWKV